MLGPNLHLSHPKKIKTRSRSRFTHSRWNNCNIILHSLIIIIRLFFNFPLQNKCENRIYSAVYFDIKKFNIIEISSVCWRRPARQFVCEYKISITKWLWCGVIASACAPPLRIRAVAAYAKNYVWLNKNFKQNDESTNKHVPEVFFGHIAVMPL